MGYTKIVQYGNITEVYEYEKTIRHHRRHRVSSIVSRRNKKIREEKKRRGFYERSRGSINRSRNNFFRLCHHNNSLAVSIHFFTLTFAYDAPYKTASRHVRHYMERIKKRFREISISYISVPELQKSGRIHFHLLVYDLPPEETRLERETRNFQRLFERGYVDIVFARDSSPYIAGYMSKYMGKALGDFKNETRRGYNTSRNIKKIRSAGGNTLSLYEDMIVPTGSVENKEYVVPFLGRCVYKKVTV